MVTWCQRDGSFANNKPISNAYAVHVVGGRPVTRGALEILHDADYTGGIASDGTGYLALYGRGNRCLLPDWHTIGCGVDLLGVRLAPDGSPIDANGLRIRNGPERHPENYRHVFDVGFDGDNYLVTWVTQADVIHAPLATPSVFLHPSHMFAARVSSDGTVLDNEAEGLLIASDGRPISKMASAFSATGGVFAWFEHLLEDAAVTVDAGYRLFKAQRVFARSPGPEYPEMEIGQISLPTLTEGQVVGMRVFAPSLDPASAVYSASGLPEGAVFDSSRRLFRWKPDARQRGTYSGVTFSASDGSTSVEQAVTLTVDEGILSLGGGLVGENGVRAEGIAIELVGAGGVRWLTFSDAIGHYHFDGVKSGARYKLRLGKPSRKLFRSTPRMIRPEVGVDDLSELNFTITPR